MQGRLTWLCCRDFIRVQWVPKSHPLNQLLLSWQRLSTVQYLGRSNSLRWMFSKYLHMSSLWIQDQNSFYPVLRLYNTQDFTHHALWITTSYTFNHARHWTRILLGHISLCAHWFTDLVSEILGQPFTSPVAARSPLSPNTGECSQSWWPFSTLVNLQCLEIYIWCA